MKTDDIREDDELRAQDGSLVYTVQRVTVNRPHVVLHVKFAADGGYGKRVFELGQTVPLTRPQG